MDELGIKTDVINFLGIVQAADKRRVDRAFAHVVTLILGFTDWSFLDTEGSLSVDSSKSLYNTAGDFVYPLKKTVRCEKDNITIDIVSEEWVHSMFPDPTAIIGLKYCVFFGRKVKFYRTNALTSTKTVKYGYHKRGSLVDLDFDPEFEGIIHDGIIMKVAKGKQINEGLRFGRLFRGALESKGNLYKRTYGGDSKFVPSKRESDFQSLRKELRWK